MSRFVTIMTIDDVGHISSAEKETIADSYEDHEREARMYGIPALGSGRVFPVAEEKILCDPVEIPKYWAQIIGIDFGWDHPFAAVRLAWDKDNDIIYVCNSYREKQSTPIIHSAAIKPWGDWIPVAWPHDGLSVGNRETGEGLMSLYKAQGLNMLYERATYEDGGMGVEPGVIDMLDRMKTGRWKVFRHLHDWREEFRLYHRKDGKIVKMNDDLISATRYALMMKRFAMQGGAGFNRKIEYPKMAIA